MNILWIFKCRCWRQNNDDAKANTREIVSRYEHIKGEERGKMRRGTRGSE